MAIILFILGYAAFSALFALWTDRALDYVASLIAGHVVDLPFLLSWAVSFFAGPVTFAFNLITEVLRYVI